MIAFPTKYEVYYDDKETMIAKFNMFDDESFDVEIKTILSSDDLRKIADLLDEVSEINEKGINNENING